MEPSIRLAEPGDAGAVARLTEQLGYEPAGVADRLSRFTGEFHAKVEKLALRALGKHVLDGQAESAAFTHRNEPLEAPHEPVYVPVEPFDFHRIIRYRWVYDADLRSQKRRPFNPEREI